MDPTRPRPPHERHKAEKTPEKAAAPQRDLGTLGDRLRRLAASEMALYLKTKAAHWTVTGPHFRDLHLMLDENADLSIEAVDQIAERCAQLDVLPPLGLQDVEKLTVVADRDGQSLSNREMLEAIVADTDKLVELFRQAVREADGQDDAASVDMLSKIVRKHEFRGWFIRRTITKIDGIEKPAI
jgi:starvation-inducible DNA-binding protein